MLNALDEEDSGEKISSEDADIIHEHIENGAQKGKKSISRIEVGKKNSRRGIRTLNLWGTKPLRFQSAKNSFFIKIKISRSSLNPS